MNGIYRLLITLGTIAALALLTGCGQNSTNGATQSPSTVTPGLSSTATHKPTTTPLPTATTALLPTATAGTVTLRTNAASYHVSDTITVTLNHASNQTIHFPDHLTDCTVILLQREVIAHTQCWAESHGPTCFPTQSMGSWPLPRHAELLYI